MNFIFFDCCMLNNTLKLFFILLLFSIPANAIIITDNFDSGINDSFWDIECYNANSAPWAIIAPDESNRLRISKSSDDGTSLSAVSFQFRFTIIGDFSVWINYDLVDFPLSNNGGWNHVGLVARIIDEDEDYTGTYFGAALDTDDSVKRSFGYANIPPAEYFGSSIDTTISGKLGISREGNTMSAWIDRGYGPVLIGALTYPELNGPTKVLFSVNQQENILLERPTTSLDLRFDNFYLTADTIIPEPSTFLLLSIAITFVFRKKK